MNIYKKNTEKNTNIWHSPNQIYPINKKYKSSIINNLFNLLEKGKGNMKKKSELMKILKNDDDKKLREYSKKVYDIVYLNKNMKDPEVSQGIKLFQTALIEMTGFAKSIPRDQKGKTMLDHLLGVLDNILNTEKPTIEQCIIAILHDSIEEIPGYTLGHIRKTYGEKIANAVDTISKKYNKESIKKLVQEDLGSLLSIGIKKSGKTFKELSNLEVKKILEQEIIEKSKEIYDKNRHIYYDNMPNWDYDVLKVKFADRLDALRTLDGLEKNKKIKKMCETKKYFLIDQFKDTIEGYDELENQYNINMEELKNKDIDSYKKILQAQ